MVELHVEALDEFCGKRLDGRIARLCVGVADSAHRLVFAARELVEMAANTRLVSAKFAHYRAAGSGMARIAGELFVLRNFMRERLEGRRGRSLRNRIGRVGGCQRHGDPLALLEATCRKQRQGRNDEHGLDRIFEFQ